MSLKTGNPTTKYCKNLCQVLSRNKETAVSVSSHYSLSTKTLPSKMSADDDITVKNEVVSSGYVSSRAHHISECVGPPIGVFWDIENCSIPFNKSAISIVTKIRHRFFNDHREAEFMCVCDISKENKDVIQELNYAQVTVVHINATSKNTADDKIRQLLRRFAADHPPPATVILISGDVNFASELSDLRYRHHLHVILIHRRSASSALLSCPHECYCFDDFVMNVEDRKTPETDTSTDLLVCNLPVFEETTSNAKVRNRLRQLGSNCRGRVISIRGGTARIRFPNKEAMLRAQKRMNGEDVFGCKINVRFIDSYVRQQRDQSPAISYLSSSTTGYQAVLASREIDSDPELPRRSVSFSGSITLEPRHTIGRDENVSRPIIQRNAVSFRSNCLSLSDFHEMCHISNDANNEKHVDYQHCVGTDGVESPHCVFTSGDDADSDIIICGPAEEIVLEAETVDSAPAILDKIGSKSVTCCGGEKSKPAANETTERIIKSKRKKKNVVKSDAVEEPVKQMDGEQTKRVSSAMAERTLPTPSSSEMDNMPCKYTADNALDSVIPANDIKSDGAVGLPEHKQRANSSCKSIWPTKQLSEMAQSQVLTDSPFNPLAHSGVSRCERPVGSLASQTDNTALPVVANRGDTDSRGVTNSVLPQVKGSCTPLLSSSDHVSLTGQAPSFRRTPGARRPNAGSMTNYGHRSPRANSNSPLVPRPLFPPSFTGMTSYGRFPNSSIAGGDSNVDRWISPPNFHHTSTNNKYNSGGLHIETEKYSGLGVELVVSNLDNKISEYDWKEILNKEFQQQVKVLSVSVLSRPDGLCVGYIRVPTITDACRAVTLFHRRKIGCKRIHVAINEQLSPDDFKSEIVGLFHAAAVNSMSLSKLLEMYGTRYNHCCDLPQLYSMNDVRISEGGAMGKIVSLVNSLSNNSPSTSSADEEVRELMESPVCLKHHTPNSDDAESLAYVEAMDISSVPLVNLQLRSFATRVHILLQSHGGSVSLASFPYCYAAEFERIHPAEESGVPLEHLIACVSGVQLAKTMSGVKKVEWAKNNAGSLSDVVPVHVANTNAAVGVPLTQFSHNVVELLCHSPKCCLLLSNFGLAYHRRFGQICRIGDYGYHSLGELLDAISDVVQVIGEGSLRCVTLTHQVQVKRFTADLLRLLQSQLGKKISIADLPSAYRKLTGKVFNVTEFGLCFIEDLLGEVADDAIQVSGAGADLAVYLAQCRQENDENVRRFAADVVQLLKHCPHYRVSFDCFMLSFKQHFGRECRLSDYGLTMKLNELLEVIPRVCRVVNDPTGGRQICLTECELLHILESNVSSMLRSASSNCVSVGEFLCEYSKHFGHSLCLDDFGVHSIIELIEKLHKVVKVEKTNDGQQFIYLINSHTVWTVACNILLILMDQSRGSLSVAELSELYYEMFHVTFDLRQLSSDLSGFVQLSTQVNFFHNSEAGAGCNSNTDTVVKLCPLQLFARDARTILIRHAGGRLPLRQFISEYEQFFGVHLSPASYGFLTVEALIQAVPLVLSMRGKRVLLTPRFRDKLSSSSLESKCGTNTSGNAYSRRDENLMSESVEEDVLSTVNGTTADLLSEPVPSSVPSPDLQPEPHQSSSCLMRFDSSSCPQDFLVLTDAEKRGLKTPLCSTPNSDLLRFAAQFMPSSSRVSSTVAELRSEVSQQSRLRNGDRNIMSESGNDLSGSFYAGVPEEKLSRRVREQQPNGANAIPYSETGKSPSLLGYPPMPTSAQLVSVVQDQIIQAVGERSLTPSASCSEVSSCSTPAAVCSTSDTDVVVSTTVDSSVECRVDTLSSSQTEVDSTAGSASASRTRLTTPRRSRIVARLNLLSTLNADPSANH